MDSPSGSSTPPSSFPRSSTPPSYSPGTSTRPSFSPGSSRSAQNLGKAECSNCKFLAEKIKTLEARIRILEGQLEMERHPENHTLESAAILHEIYNGMGNLNMELRLDSVTTTKTEDKVEGRLPLDIVISKLRVLPSSSCFPLEMRLCWILEAREVVVVISGLVRLGGNSLGGTIPLSIIELKKLGKLNISNNGLTGDIPSGFSKLEMLEQLDASQPSYRNFSISLAELRVLAQINISYNLFTGDIPASLLNSSFYSFVGNPCLCVHCVLNNCDANLTRNLRRCKETTTTTIPNTARSRGMGYDKKEDGILFQKVMEATEDLNDNSSPCELPLLFDKQDDILLYRYPILGYIVVDVSLPTLKDETNSNNNRTKQSLMSQRLQFKVGTWLYEMLICVNARSSASDANVPVRWL
ncbi:receptor-like protein kinase [Tanacetum coccineum]|uniref:Receptor-like protein kinase n=1 Tax=Tanacetum coccineum TaxID=301880 RepID=A0ABQ4ZJ36_9ASTR